MKFQCCKCKKIFNRDMRLKINKLHYKKNGYFISFCEKTFTMVNCMPIKK